MQSNTKPRKSGGSKQARGQTKVPGVVEIGPFCMHKGRYYVGDLCNVLTDNEREELSDTIGKFTLADGREVVIFKLPYGDGIYPDFKGRNHLVDSGTIGLTLAVGLKETGTVSGHIVDYKDIFHCMSANLDHPEKGMVAFILFGDEVDINTDDQLGGVSQLAQESGKRVTFNVPGIEIDYIRPLASFKDITSCTVDTVTVELRKALNFNNTRLLPAVQNSLKGGTYDAEAYAQSKAGLAIAKLEETWK
jgi:hypothetical protein